MAATPESVTKELIAWISSVLPGADVRPLPLRAPPLNAGVDVRLVALTPHDRAPRGQPRQVIDLDYLITVRMQDAAVEQAAAADLLFAAADRHDLELPAEPTVGDICASLGLPRSLGFVLRTPMPRVRADERAPRVRHPLIVRDAALQAIEGVVVGPEGMPVAGAIVTEKGVGRSVRTDARGRFRIMGASHVRDIALNVQGKGTSIDAVADLGQDIVIRLQLEA